MSNPVPYLLQGKNIILVINGKSYTVSKDTHISYNKIVDALKNKNWDELVDLVEPKKAIIDFGKGNVTIDGDTVYWNNKPFHNSLSTRMIEMYAEGFPIDPMVRFMENLMNNPSKQSVDQLYGFLEKNKLPITEDGCFLAYKKVRSDYYDIHSGTFDNKVGQVVSMERNEVDDNPDRTCSTGLHFCSESYLDHFGNSNDPIMILKINPADVVSIPSDYNGAKGRCMRYEVIAEVSGKPENAFNATIDTTYSVKKEQPTAVWPFDSPNNTTVPTDKYSVLRVYGNNVEAADLTLVEAKEMVAKYQRQKKAMLKIVDSNGVQVY